MKGIAQEISKEVRHELGDIIIDRLEPIRSKDGVHVCRGIINNKHAVIKYFEKEEFRREINNYKLLNKLGIKTINVFGYCESCIILEDINFSDVWRLGISSDLDNEEVATNLAHWYFDLHEKGKFYENLKDMYKESDMISDGNLKLLREKMPEARETLDFLLNNLERLKEVIESIEKTIVYNDFYWTNMIVRKDEKEAMIFDYNFLGSGYRFSDLRNVTSSLSERASIKFLKEYNKLYIEKYDVSRECEEELEVKIDKIVSGLMTLIMAYDKDIFPSWAEEEKESLLNGHVLEIAKNLV